ncbi:MAG: amino acid permease [Planctomycetes bacterium]|nr:amino acid permease [Planctomycetota bacterium]
MENAPKKQLTVFDGVCIIVGIIIGAGIYETAPVIASSVGSAPATLGIWLMGGLLALTGSLCYADLATAFPQQGGDYIYLSEAYGPGAGFLFGWSQLLVIRPGDIALMAFIFARYAAQLIWFTHCTRVYAFLAIFILTLLNLLGIRQGKWTQNILTVLKVLGLAAIFAAAILAPGNTQTTSDVQWNRAGIQLAFILVLFTYGGWNEIAYVAAEIKHPRRNIIRTIMIGTLSVVLIYLLVNLAFLSTLGHAGVARSEAVAVNTVAKVFPHYASRLIAALICISSLGALNGLIFTGARISYALGQNQILFRQLGRWKSATAGPVYALALEGALSLLLVLIAGSFIDTILYTAPAVWLFFLGTVLSLFILRRKKPSMFHPVGVIRARVIPAAFCATCVFMLFNCIHYAATHKPAALLVLTGLLFSGIIVYRLQQVKLRG